MRRANADRVASFPFQLSDPLSRPSIASRVKIGTIDTPTPSSLRLPPFPTNHFYPKTAWLRRDGKLKNQLPDVVNPRVIPRQLARSSESRLKAAGLFDEPKND